MRSEFPMDAQITLNHRYSNNYDYAESEDFGSVPPGGNNKYWPVFYATGIDAWGSDHWRVDVVLKIEPPSNSVESRAKVMTNEKPDKQCELQSSDRGQKMTFIVNGAGFSMGIPSGGCSDKWLTPLSYNTAAFLQLKNSCAKDMIGGLLEHKYSNDKTYKYDFGPIQSGMVSTEIFMMEYFTGASHPG